MNRSARFSIYLLAVLLVLGVPGLAAALRRPPAPDPASPAALPASLRDLRLKDDAGQARTLAEFRDRKAMVLIFLGTECPISNGYAATLAELAQRYGPRGAQFLGVNAIPDEDLAAVAAQAKGYHLGFPVLKDDRQALADGLGARV